MKELFMKKNRKCQVGKMCKKTSSKVMWQLINKQRGSSRISNQVIVLKTDSEKIINSLNVDD